MSESPANQPSGSLFRGGIVLALFAIGALLTFGPYGHRPAFRLSGGAVFVLAGVFSFLRRRDVAEWSDLLHLGSPFSLTPTQRGLYPWLWGSFWILFGLGVIVVTTIR